MCPSYRMCIHNLFSGLFLFHRDLIIRNKTVCVSQITKKHEGVWPRDSIEFKFHPFYSCMSNVSKQSNPLNLHNGDKGILILWTLLCF